MTPLFGLGFDFLALLAAVSGAPLSSEEAAVVGAVHATRKRSIREP